MLLDYNIFININYISRRINLIMKKHIIAALFCAAAALLPLCAAAEPEPSAEISYGTYDADLGGYNILYRLRDIGETPQGTVIAAAYTSDGVLTAAETAAVPMTHTGKVFLSAPDDAYARLFVWDGLDTMRPYAFSQLTDLSGLSAAPPDYYADFEDPAFQALGNITEVKECGGLTFYPRAKADDMNFNERGYLDMPEWNGSIDNCAIKLHVLGSCHITLYARSRSSEIARPLVIKDSSNVTLTEMEFPPLVPTAKDFDYTGSEGDLYITTGAGPVLLYSIEVIYDYDGTADDYEATDQASLRSAIKRAQMHGSGTVFINSNYMDCNREIELGGDCSGITLCAGEGYTPILDFAEMFGEDYAPKDGSNKCGITIRGSGYTIRNLTIRHAPGNGVRITGENAHDNLIENIVTSYNGAAGINITYAAHDNTAKNCYSYRNCDIPTLGQNADGFGIYGFAGAGNKAISCYSWENADDGFDLFRNYNDVTFENCFAWHNGEGTVYTGREDFEAGRPLDENLMLVRAILKVDPDFRNNYESGVFSLPDEKFLTVIPDVADMNTKINVNPAEFEGTVPDENGNMYWNGNANAFKLGSGATANGDPQVTASAVRRMTNCICFDHKHKGFDRNNSECTVYINNCLAFDNRGRNYHLQPCTVPEFNNAYIHGGDYSLPKGLAPIALSDSDFDIIKARIDEEVAAILQSVENGEIPSAHMEKVFD